MDVWEYPLSQRILWLSKLPFHCLLFSPTSCLRCTVRESKEIIIIIVCFGRLIVSREWAFFGIGRRERYLEPQPERWFDIFLTHHLRIHNISTISLSIMPYCAVPFRPVYFFFYFFFFNKYSGYYSDDCMPNGHDRLVCHGASYMSFVTHRSLMYPLSITKFGNFYMDLPPLSRCLVSTY